MEPQRSVRYSDTNIALQREYFGAHTFRVLPGKENAKLKAGEDIRGFLPLLADIDCDSHFR